MKAALLVIDMQKQYRAQGGAMASSMDTAVKYIEWAIGLFKKKGLPVFHIVHNEAGPEALKDENFWELDAIAAPDRKDVIVKTKGSAFSGTDLQERLKAAGVDMLVLTGLAAEYCVLNTYKAAENLDWNLAILKGSLAGPDPENVPFVERICETVSAGALAGFLS